MKAVVKERFRDKYTDEVYEAGRVLELTHERYAEIRATNADLIVAVVEEQTAGQQGTADSENEEQAAGQQEAAGQKPKRTKKQDKQDE